MDTKRALTSWLKAYSNERRLFQALSVSKIRQIQPYQWFNPFDQAEQPGLVY